MNHRVDGYGAGRHFGQAFAASSPSFVAVVAVAAAVVVVAADWSKARVATARDVRYSSLCYRR
ncbi:MAG TPA: hypothetical protein VHZ03_25375 [Trebonia sp.]|jgi:hypothetical protein|nr:hypothetical protein [Trebonia sp.]